VFATVRLRALTDSLGENDPQYQQEAAFTAAQWRRRLREHAQFAVLIGNRPAGLIGAQVENAKRLPVFVVARPGLAVRPGATAGCRRVDWARDWPGGTVTLRVAADNAWRAVCTKAWDSQLMAETCGQVRSRCRSAWLMSGR
jgi:hypothetical protein